jgi:hypothetical protein
MAKLLEIFSAQKRLWQQSQEIAQLRSELAKLRIQNDSMRDGMRRCVTCDYRIDFKQRQDAGSDAQQVTAPLQTDNEQ